MDVTDQIRFLVESYYDTQKLRLETFNRIVAYVGSNLEKFTSHNNFGALTANASQVPIETQTENASQFKIETQFINASHKNFETHLDYASQDSDEVQKNVASRTNVETHNVNASHIKFETQDSSASRIDFETQDCDASHRIFESQVIHASQYKSEIQGNSASQGKPETQLAGAVKPSKIAKELVSGKREIPDEVGALVWYHNSLYETEKQLVKRIDAWSSLHPVRVNFLNKVAGIGPILSSGVIAWISPIERFSNISKLWAYCGLSPGQKRERGKKLGYNPRLKTFMWKIASSFEKLKPERSYYRRVYNSKKKYYMEREDLKKAIEDKEKGAKLHVRLMAMRYTEKRFLSDLWLEWRRIQGLPVTEPYAHKILGHGDFESWEPDKV
jgi:transposase